MELLQLFIWFDDDNDDEDEDVFRNTEVVFVT